MRRIAATAVLLVLVSVSMVLAACPPLYLPLIFNQTAPPPTPTPTPTALPVCPPDRNEAWCTYVVDGDTIAVLIDGQTYTVRYIGMDTPEVGQSYYQ